ncbi:MAG: hypothetical protein AAB686_01090, partial [Patescibacteria group bacterium]
MFDGGGVGGFTSTTSFFVGIGTLAGGVADTGGDDGVMLGAGSLPGSRTSGLSSGSAPLTTGLRKAPLEVSLPGLGGVVKLNGFSGSGGRIGVAGLGSSPVAGLGGVVAPLVGIFNLWN